MEFLIKEMRRWRWKMKLAINITINWKMIEKGRIVAEIHAAINRLLNETSRNTCDFMNQLLSEIPYLDSEACLELEITASSAFTKCSVKNGKGSASEQREYSMVFECQTYHEYPNEETLVQEFCTKTKEKFIEIFKRNLKKEFDSERVRQYNLDQYVKQIAYENIKDQ